MKKYRSWKNECSDSIYIFLCVYDILSSILIQLGDYGGNIMNCMVIQEKATAFLAKENIINILHKYGIPTIVGSYRMQIMTWNDLDFYMSLSDFDIDHYYGLVKELINVLKPIRFDGICNPEKKLFFIGMEVLYDEERWNIDIWWKNESEIADSVSYANDLILQMQLHPELKDAVIRIKQELINRKQYGFDKGKVHYHSNEIYDAVFRKGILTEDQFLSQKGELL